ncbi:MAG: tetratricopeptide repeat protein, partial [Myxococcota bacterium]
MRLSAGQQIGHYALDYRLGAGGMAEVWAATNTILGVQVALKILFSGNPMVQQRLLREGRTQAALDHPNILPVRDVIDVGGSLGLILPLIQGPSLDKLLQKYRPTLDEAVALFRAIVKGVGYAHEYGLIHRDLKPGNVLLDERRGQIVPRVADFGLVKRATGSGQTQPQAVMGTLQYAAPEQLLDAARVNHRADLFSLGVILTELVGEKRPFQGESLRELLTAYQAKPDLVGVPGAFETLCRRLLAPDPEDRPSDCAQVLDALNRVHPMGSGAVLGPSSRLAQAIRRETFRDSVEVISRVPPSQTQMLSGSFADSLFDAASRFPEETPASKHNLPAELDAFIGRSAALAALQEGLTSSRLVTIMGTGGTGKTRLALQFARKNLSDYPGGVFFCDLSEAQNLDRLLFVVSQAMDVALSKGDHLKQLGHAIAGHGQCLMIFDNFEQLIEHAPQTVERWLKRAAQARFVVTSRTLLEINGERTLRLPPLEEAEGVALFVKRARAKKRTFALTDHNRAAVHNLVRLLDGLPLAIELATARLKVMSPSKMLSRMGQRFRLLSTGKRNTARRQATLKAAIDWSWDLLMDWEKAAFSQCAVFEGGFTLEAAEAVIDLDAFADAPWPMDAVQSLVDKSLLVMLGENRLGEMRFGMLMSIHDYAREKLERTASDTAHTAHHRHAAFYAANGDSVALEALDRFGGVDRWWALKTEVDNLRSAHRFALQHADAEHAARLALALFSIAERQQPAIALKALIDTLPLPGMQTRPQLRVRVLIRLGLLYSDQGQIAEATDRHRAAQVIACAIGDRRSEGHILNNLGGLFLHQSQRAEAEDHYRRALAIAREVGDRANEARVLSNLGQLYEAAGRFAETEDHYRRALAIARELGNRMSAAKMLNSLGNLLRVLGQHAEATDCYQYALTTAREVGDRPGEGRVLTNLGNLHSDMGQVATAAADYQQALTIMRESGDRRNEGITLGNLGILHSQRGMLESAKAAYQGALAIAREIGDRLGEGMMLASLGNLHLIQDQLSAAEDHYNRALQVPRERGEWRIEGMV